MNDIETKPISKLIRNENTPDRAIRVEQFLIPSYQRGYRWIANIHVDALLEDIDHFIKQQSQPNAKSQSYCLQPVVMVERLDDSGYRIWEIIDGQQRLTTIYLILRCLGQDCFSISFEKRQQSEDFLKNISLSTLSHDSPDEYFISEAYKYICNWFDKKSKTDAGYKLNFTATLINKVQVIWYSVKLSSSDPGEQETEKIDFFNRLNIGKIPLEDAELVRALLMSKVGGSEQEKNFRQAEMSNEWYTMEQWLRNDSVWNFFTDSKVSNHIQLIFELQSHNKNPQNYNIYKWFEKQVYNQDLSVEINGKSPVDKAQELWKETKNIFSKLHYWFSNRRLYHLIGFLLASKSKTIQDILKQSNCSKKEFQMRIEEMVKEFINSINQSDLTYEEPQTLKKYLLLFNVLTVEQIRGNEQTKFPFNLYNEKKWSLEHIHAQQSQDPFKTQEPAMKWIKETLQSIGKIEHIEKDVVNENGEIHKESINIIPLLDELRKMDSMEKIDLDKFNEIRSKIVDVFESPSTKHLLDNMALLTVEDNAGLNNSIFPVKRDKIIKKYKEGNFIPPCTLNVFLKFYSKADDQPFYWGKVDKENYIKEINRVISNFKVEINHD